MYVCMYVCMYVDVPNGLVSGGNHFSNSGAFIDSKGAITSTDMYVCYYICMYAYMYMYTECAIT